MAYAAAAETATVRSVVKGEMSAKTTHSRSAKGPTSISECSAEGTFVTLENTGRRVGLSLLILSRRMIMMMMMCCDLMNAHLKAAWLEASLA